MSKMKNRDFINKLCDSIKTEAIREVNQEIINNNISEIELIDILMVKLLKHKKQ